ncbi:MULTISPECIES: outer membrane lipoprotein chaperone LolA [Marinomonas]|jgi:outer membrane lipoprotein carrier protein|uniref:outer membrane lipoprotein chaperone LolA n=1 Tax=Marinomonas TaxID=28253 RepID=UPI0010543DE4|nr:outer membrane lipoprotein chaperone LolA [Marinomonas sp. KMM3893]
MYKMMLVLLVLFAGAANAESSASAQLTQLLNQNRNVEGEFRQSTYDEKGNQVQVSNGIFLLSKPNKFVWDSVSPYAQRIISDGKTILVWDVDLQQATKKPFAGTASNSPAALLGQPAESVLPHYVVTKLGDHKYRLEPKNKEEMFKTLTLAFKNSKVSAMSIIDGLGQTTLIEFKKVEQHKGVANANFSMAVPDDVDVIVEGQ